MAKRAPVVSRRCAHFHGATARIDDSAIRAWIGIEKSTRSSQVVATLHHSHVRGAEEQLDATPFVIRFTPFVIRIF